MKAMFEWKAQYSVGIKSIDAQHQNLFAIAKELYDAMSAGHGKSSLARILTRLTQYTVVHFAHEERLLRQYGYGAADSHHEEHEELTRIVLKFQEDFHSDKVIITVQLLHFLKDWLEHHIQESDMAYAPYLKSKAVA